MIRPASLSPIHLLAMLVAFAGASLALLGCGGDSGDGGGDSGGAAAGSEPIEHVHGLGVDPTDGSLLIATHSGLFRSPEGSPTAERVGESRQDTMGFSVAGPSRYLGSGHPGPGEGGPSSLGLIESDDGGKSWQGVSLAGEADFHVLRYVGDQVYGVNGLTGLIMRSPDGGRSWTEVEPPAPVVDLVVNPDQPQELLVSTEVGLSRSEDGGESWETIAGPIGLFAWAEPEKLYLVDGSGGVQLSEDGGASWSDLGDIGGQPAAFAAAQDGALYAALGDGTVMSSTDGGRSWDVRSSQ